MKNDIKKLILTTIGVIVFALVLFKLDDFVNKTRVVDPVQIHKERQGDLEEKFNQYGLEVGQALAEIPFHEDDNYIFYEDRILSKFKYKIENLENGRNILEKLNEIIPKNTSLYLMPIPQRVIWENNHQEQTKLYRKFLIELYDIIPEGIVLLDPLQILLDHSEEYLFFRTDDSITSRGAYYISRLLCGHMGLSPISLDEYDEHQYRTFVGGRKIFTRRSYVTNKDMVEMISNIPNDPSYHYILPGSKNMVIRAKEVGDKVVTENVVLVAKPRLGKAAIIGNEYLYAVADGEGKDEEKHDKTALLLSDSNGHMLVPFLTPYYHKVYVINIFYHDYNQVQFENIFREYNISDVIIAQKSGDIGLTSQNRFFNGILK